MTAEREVLSVCSEGLLKCHHGPVAWNSEDLPQ